VVVKVSSLTPESSSTKTRIFGFEGASCSSERDNSFVRGMPMLDDCQFLHYINSAHSLTEEAKNYIINTRTKDPSRMVGVNARASLCSWVMSNKMGHTVSLESRGPERAFFILCEYDDRIVEYWDQPEPVRIERTTKLGKSSIGWYHPDALLLTQDGPRVIEVKAQDEVEKLINKNSVDWRSDGYGNVSYLPAKSEFLRIGISHEVFVYDHKLRYKIENLKLLMDSRSLSRFSSEQLEITKNAISDQFYYSLYDLKEKLELDSYTGLFQMVDEGHLFIDLDNTLLTSPKGCVVTLDKPLLPEAMRIHHDGKIYSDGCLSDVTFSKVPSRIYAIRALENLCRVESGEKSRSVSRWKKLIKEGRDVGLTPFQALIPKYYQSGNRKLRLPIIVIEFLIAFLLEDYARSQGLGIYRGYKRYCEKAKAIHPGYHPVSRQTFSKKLEQIPPDVIAKIRGGRRAENAAKQPVDAEKRALKAQCAWEIAAADHYEADIFVIIFSAENFVYVVRPYISALIDLYSGSVVGISISLRSPSRRSIARLLRDCVRRHGRLPAEIIVDRGAEFKSVYFAALLADKKITLTIRPAGDPRYGSEVERLFGEFKEMWLSQRPGNIKDYKEVRSVDGKKSPAKMAILQPYDLYCELQNFLEWRDVKQRGIGNESASETLNRSTREFPFVGKKVNLDSEFLIATSVDEASYTIDHQRGLHIGDMYYWSPELSFLRGRQNKTDVRADAENPHVVYAKIGHKWVPCYSSRINAYSALDPVSQYVSGLELIDAVSDKRAIREEADSELARMINEMDNIAFGKEKLSGIDEVGGTQKIEESIFDMVRNTDVNPLNTEFWSG
jgi:transposase InsO family protein